MHSLNEEYLGEIQLKKRSDLHLARKLFHAAGIGFIIGLYSVLPRDIAIMAMSITCLIFVPIDFLRTKSNVVNKLFIRFFSKFLRRSEAQHLTGSSYLGVSVLILIAFFPRDITILALSMLALGDPTASLIGVMYGKDKLIGEKSLQGSLACFFVCFFIAIIYYFSNNLMTERLFLVSMVSGLIGAFSELIPIGKLDDNFSFPILTAILLYGTFILFGGFV